jgi:CHAD domain-containing protein
VIYSDLFFQLKDLGKNLAISRDAYVRLRLFRSLINPIRNEAQDAVTQTLKKLGNDLAHSKYLLHQTTHGEHWQCIQELIQSGIEKKELMRLSPKSTDITIEVNKFKNALLKLSKSKGKEYSSQKMLHRLRVKVKRTRYIGSALQDIAHCDLSKELKIIKSLQSALGDLHDSAQLINWCNKNIGDSILTNLLHNRITERNMATRDQIRIRLTRIA